MHRDQIQYYELLNIKFIINLLTGFKKCIIRVSEPFIITHKYCGDLIYSLYVPQIAIGIFTLFFLFAFNKHHGFQAAVFQLIKRAQTF